MIDSPISHSYIRMALYGVFVAIIGVLSAGLPVWQLGVCALVFVLLLGSMYLMPQIRHITSPPTGMSDWQFVVKTARDEMLYSGTVLDLSDYGFCVVCHFMMYTPVMQSMRLVIYADMIKPDDYRKLKAQARFFK